MPPYHGIAGCSLSADGYGSRLRRLSGNLTSVVVDHNSHSALLRYDHFQTAQNITLIGWPRMTPVPASFLPPIALERGGKTPMDRQLYDWFRRAIIAGQLRPGQRVPSTRGLASELKISPKGTSRPSWDLARVWPDPFRAMRRRSWLREMRPRESCRSQVRAECHGGQRR
jgi:hypothetical protein